MRRAALIVFLVTHAVLVCAADLAVPSLEYPTIQSAIVSAEAGDVITVDPGTYTENLVFTGVDFTLRSTCPCSPEITVIDGGGLASTVSFQGSESASCVVSGLTITGGRAARGGGVAGNNTLATVERCVIRGNTATSNGGGIAAFNGMIRQNRIIDNVVENLLGVGGGLSDCNGVIQDNRIEGNRIVLSGSPVAIMDGGGLFGCDGVIERNVIVGNGMFEAGVISDLRRGGGLSMCDAEIRGNVIAGNRANVGGGLYECLGALTGNTIADNVADESGGGVSDCRGPIINSIVWGNIAPEDPTLVNSSTPSFSCIEDGVSGGSGNIATDPLFANPSGWDYHLPRTSPCVDAGASVELTLDIDGDSRPFDAVGEVRGDGSGFDMGADEFVGVTASHILGHLLGRFTLVGDDFDDANVNNDSILDVADLVGITNE